MSAIKLRRSRREGGGRGRKRRASNSDKRLHILWKIGHRGKCSAIKKGHITVNGFMARGLGAGCQRRNPAASFQRCVLYRETTVLRPRRRAFISPSENKHVLTSC